MLGFVVRRALSAFLVVVLTSMFVFALFFLGPTDPARPFCDLNGRCTPEKLKILTHEMGLDDNVAHQYAVFVVGLFVGREVQLGAKYECDAPFLVKRENRKGGGKMRCIAQGCGYSDSGTDDSAADGSEDASGDAA